MLERGQLDIIMENLSSFLTVPNILFVIGIFGTVFTVYNRITTPQQRSELSDALQQQREKIFAELYEKRFTETQSQIKELTRVNQNHLHTLETKIDGAISSQNQTNIEIAKLETTIGLLLKLPASAPVTNVIQNPPSL